MGASKIVLIVVTFLLAMPFSVNCKEPAETAQESNFYKIHEIKQGKLKDRIFYTEGFVVKIYTCPSCDAGSQCKPCMKNNIVISENNVLLKAYYLTGKDLIIFSEHAKQFTLGKKYKFLIKMTDEKTTSEPINDIELIYYKLL